MLVFVVVDIGAVSEKSLTNFDISSESGQLQGRTSILKREKISSQYTTKILCAYLVQTVHADVLFFEQ